MILFYTEKITPRVDYTVRLFFEQILQVNIAFTDSYNDFLNAQHPKINYSHRPFNEGVSVQPHGLLFSNKIESFEIPAGWVTPEDSNPDGIIPNDVFSAAFYFVSRYEEYIISERDHYGRFSAEQSILYSAKLLNKPVVNIWANLIAKAITVQYPGFKWPERKFAFYSTIDVDNAWAFRNKGFFRTSGALLKSLLTGKSADFAERLKALTGTGQDPYDNYRYLDLIFSRNTDKVIFFFLLGNYNKYDKNISYRNTSLRKLIGDTAKKYKTGIHPSFSAATDKTGQIQRLEKERLEKITGSPVNISRQHFLKISIPETQRNLINSGIEFDYSLGYASQTGFRGGICTPFYFYDLERETTTNLVVVPFQVMDVTLRQYLEYTPQKALNEILDLMKEVKNVKGTFVSVWHNESVNNHGQWKGWREVFETMNQTGFEWSNE